MRVTLFFLNFSPMFLNVMNRWIHRVCKCGKTMCENIYEKNTTDFKDHAATWQATKNSHNDISEHVFFKTGVPATNMDFPDDKGGFQQNKLTHSSVLTKMNFTPVKKSPADPVGSTTRKSFGQAQKQKQEKQKTEPLKMMSHNY